MTTWVDSAFRIGSRHQVCEDYACSMGGSVAVSDGCSGAEDTDLGARLLSRVALRLLPGSSGDIEALGRQAATVAKSSVSLLHAGPDCLMATLLVATPAKDDGFTAACWGDGFMAFGEFGAWRGWHVQWQKPRDHGPPIERPDYPVYAVDGRGVDSDGSATAFRVNDEGECSFGDDHTPLDVGEPWVQGFPSDSVLVASDGLASFLDVKGRQVPVESVLQELLPFPFGGPNFVKLRLNRLEKRCRKLGWRHTDDIAIAAIWDDEE